MIRQACSDDVKGVEAVTQAVWSQDIDHEMFHDQVKKDTCCIQVAIDDGQVTGFVSTFLSVDVHQARRWEVDLLCVRPECQGKGLGTALIESVWDQAKAHTAHVARALVRTENVASQKAFARAGYTTDNRRHHLYLWTPLIGSEEFELPQDITLMPMDTLTYRGLWIEGVTSTAISHDVQGQVISIAQHRIASEKRINTGALIPVDEEEVFSLEARNLGEVHGEYCWWIKPLGSV